MTIVEEFDLRNTVVHVERTEHATIGQIRRGDRIEWALIPPTTLAALSQLAGGEGA